MQIIIIYIPFIDGVEVFIPVETLLSANDNYKILPNEEFDYDDGSILFEYGEGDIVACTTHTFENGSNGLMASQLVTSGSIKNDYKRMLIFILKNMPSISDLLKLYNSEVILQLLHDNELVYPSLNSWLNNHRTELKLLS